MSAHVVQLNAVIHLTNRCNMELMDLIILDITLCNAFSGRITGMHNSGKLLLQTKLQMWPLCKHHERSQRSRVLISATPSSLTCINEYLARESAGNTWVDSLRAVLATSWILPRDVELVSEWTGMPGCTVNTLSGLTGWIRRHIIRTTLH